MLRTQFSKLLSALPNKKQVVAKSVFPALGGFSRTDRLYATDANAKRGTGIVLLNLGGPAHQEEVFPFLLRLFSDREIIKLPVQKYASQYIARRRTPKVQRQYQLIGGGSPIRKWTEAQAELLVKKLDQMSPETAPHKWYIAFRYAAPLTEHTLEQLAKDRPSRVVAFTQYPQYSCTTTGSSMNELYRQLNAKKELISDPNIRWSVIDRWGTNPLFVKAVTRKIEDALNKFDQADRDKVVLLFSAHSIPIYVVDRGDPYPQEVSATVQAVMHELNHQNPYRLIWQSKVGPLPWLGPQVEQALTGLAQKGNKHVLLVPIAFTSDHIETLYELDIQYREVADKLGIVMHRSESLNTDPMFIDAMADIVNKHLASNKISSTQFKLRCPGCENEHCGESKQFFTEKQPAASQTASQ